jgi:hypothetical protein
MLRGKDFLQDLEPKFFRRGFPGAARRSKAGEVTILEAGKSGSPAGTLDILRGYGKI